MATQHSKSRCLLSPLPVAQNRQELRGGGDDAARVARAIRDKTETFAAKSFTETIKASLLQQQTRTMYSKPQRGFRNSLLATMALTFVVVVCITTSDQRQVSCWPTDTATSNVTIRRESNSSPAALASDPTADHQPTQGAEPRQYFKLHVAPKRTIKSSLKKAQAARRAIAAADLSASKPVASVTEASSSATANQSSYSKTQRPVAQQANNKPKTISNATLKKLLNQSLLKQATSNSTAGNSSFTSPTKTSNFKFVFIQRATAAPSAHSTAATGGRHHQQQQSQTAQQDGHRLSTVPAPQQAPSLAASVSKHLATSLLNSAASLITNLNTSAPSLTSLASQIISQSLASDNSSNQQSADDSQLNAITGGATGSSSKPSRQQKTKLSSSSPSSSQSLGGKNKISTGNGDSNQVEDGTKRTSQPAVKKPSDEKSHRRPAAGAKKPPNGRPSRPSKIYNLPIKFVANGQPSGLIVLNTIRQHFATIKKMQQNSPPGGKVTHGSGGGGQQQKRKKQHQQQPQGLKLKGNSRLIYLPLKYLSNARPNKLITSKATHKSNS